MRLRAVIKRRENSSLYEGRVYNSETGEELENVTSIEIKMNSHSMIPIMKIEVIGCECEFDYLGEIVSRTSED